MHPALRAPNIFARTPFPALLAVLVLFLILTGAGMTATTARAQVHMDIDRVSDLPTKWRNDRQLYIKGRTNITPKQLREIAAWLKTNAPNWTVVIADTADGEVYTGPNGEPFTGLDAVNNALGRGLRGNPKSPFSEQVDNDLRKRNGAILYFLQRDATGKRNLMYFSNEAQRATGLGDEVWPNGLDALAIKALDNGLRYFDAVKDTISNINQQHKDKATVEKAKHDKLMGVALLHRDHAEASLAELKLKTEEMVARNSHLTGDIVRPPLETFGVKYDELNAKLEDSPVQSGQELSMLASRIVDALANIETYRSDVGLLDEAGTRLQLLKKDPLVEKESTAAAPLKAAEENLNQAKEAYDRADSAYRQALTLAGKNMDQVEVALKIAAQRPALPGGILIVVVAIVAFIALTLVAFVLITANRPIQMRAQALVRQREAELADIPDRALGLVDRARLIIGAGSDTELRFQGKTLEEAREILREVDALYLDASAAAQQVARARTLLGTDSATGAMAMFMSGPHWEAEGLLHNDVTVRPDAPPRLLTRREKAATRAPGGDHSALVSGHLLGSVRDHPGHAFAWQHFAEHFYTHAATVEARLTALEQTLQAPAAEIAAIRAGLDELTAARKDTPVLKAAHVYETLIPAARAACVAAEEIAVRDPITAMAGQVPEATRMAANARALIETNDDLREKKAPRLLKIAEFLRQHKIRDAWVRTGLSDLDTKIEQLAQDAVTRDIEKETREVADTAAELLSRADGSVAALAALNKLHGDRETRSTALPQARAELAEKIAAALAESKGRTAPDADSTLKEQGREAERFLRVAEAQLDIARGSLMNGDTPAALHAVEIGDEALVSFDESIAQSREAAEKFVERKSTLRQEAKQVLAEAPRATAILEYLEKNFQPGALVLAEAPEDANATITDNISEFEAAMRRTAELLAAAEANLAKAAPLKAAAQFDQAAAAIQAGRVRLSEITTTAGELRAADGRNTEALEELQKRFDLLTLGAQQRTVSRATLALHEEISVALIRLTGESAALPRNPVAIGKELVALGRQASVLEARLQADQDTHDDMIQALRSAEAHLVPARDAASAFKVEQATSPDEARAAIAGIEAAQRRFNAARQLSRDDHADWAAVVDEMNAVSIETARHVAVLRGNSETAAPVLVAMESAGKAVLQAVTYVGPSGGRIAPNPGSTSISTSSGSHDLANAHSLLSAGQLANAGVTAARALHQAEAALRDAEARSRREEYEEEQERLAAKSRFEELQRQREWRKQQAPGGGSSAGGSGRQG